ncbi:MAG: class II glutamine amidotransferase [Clostridia bacterium]
MCAIFGLIDYKNVFSKAEREQIIKTLSIECMERGTDATGIAYLKNDKMTIYKRPKKASKIKLKLPIDANIILGHTRFTTQGNEFFNYNNHPFEGKIHKTKFAFAHNGVIHNDKLLRNEHNLYGTHIETDSYIAVQLLERFQTLNLNSLKSLAELVEGSFCFTLLDENKNMYFVKGENPICLLHFDAGFYIYASTDNIMLKSLVKLQFDKLSFEKIVVNDGDILKIDKLGQIERTEFESKNPYYGFYCNKYKRPYIDILPDSYDDADYINEIKSVASAFGYDEHDIDILISEGFSPDEIEDYFYAC